MSRAAYYVLCGNLGMNLGVTLRNLVQREYTKGALQSIVVALVIVMLWLFPRLHAWLDARLGEAKAQQRLAELALGEIERMQRAGNLRVNMNLEEPDRVN